jgi:uncharacterized protein (DUF1697 family)
MPVIICMLRGVNIVGRNRVEMDALKTLCVSLKLKNPRTFINSGNVIFSTKETDLPKLTKRIQDAIEKKFGFRPGVVLRTLPEFKKALGRNPFAGRSGIEPGKLLVTFLADPPGKAALAAAGEIETAGEELHILGREVFIYFVNGQGQTKLPWARIERALGTLGTGRNWNSVSKMLVLAEKLDAEE